VSPIGTSAGGSARWPVSGLGGGRRRRRVLQCL
jgi:hypothetical protein